MPQTSLKLISDVITYDSIGNSVHKETINTVYANTHSIGSKEYFAGAQAGMKPELMLTTFYANYSDEVLAEHDGVRYTIYRSFRKGDDVELYLTRYGKNR